MQKKNNTSHTGERRLTVAKRFYDRKYRRFAIFPEIRLAGKWLQKAGFDMGQKVVIKHSEKMIVIMVEEVS